MTIKQLVLSSTDFQNLQSEIIKGKNANTILLISKDEEYSFEFARLLSCAIFNNGQWLENEHVIKMEANSHPDIKIYPTKNQLLVADSEDIVSESSIKPIYADKKVFIIRNIEKSMEAAQNKLLKTLEEPSKDAFFILTTTNLNLVLPTIRSRCSKTELSKLDLKTIENFFIGQENIEIISALSDGLIGKAQKLSKTKNLKVLFDAMIDCIVKMKTSKDVLSHSKRLAMFKDDFNLLMETLSLLVEELIFIRAGKNELVRLKSCCQRLENVKEDYTYEALVGIQNLISHAVKEMSFNCNFTVVIENLLLNILEVKYLCK